MLGRAGWGESGSDMARRPISDFKRKTANRLRANTTVAEQILWRHLRRLDVKGSHFRRQVVIGPYIADFACLAERLIVEVDGSQHGDDEGLRRDDVRTRWLQSEGYRVIRFWNNDVMSRTDAVLETIHDIITVTPPRLPAAGDPPPQGRGIAYESCACVAGLSEQSAPKPASKRSLFDSGLFPIRFCCAERATHTNVGQAADRTQEFHMRYPCPQGEGK